MKAASVDIGSNTVRLMIASPGADGKMTLLHRDRAITGLANGLDSSGCLNHKRVEHTLDVLAAFTERIKAEAVEVDRVFIAGTSAIRETRSDFITKALELTGFKVKVLKEAEEAALAASGVLYSFPEVEEALLLDIGGGSTELIKVEGGKVSRSVSLPVGVVKLMERHLHSDPPTGEQVASLVQDSKETATRMIDELGIAPDGARLIATAATATTVAAMDLGLKQYDSVMVTGHKTELVKLKDMFRRLIAIPSARRLDIDGMEQGREDLIIPGLALTIEIMEAAAIDATVASDTGLLEGLCLEAMKGPG